MSRFPLSSGGRTAVVLFNLGGPDRPEAVRPFLFNLFNDPAILRVPGPVRFVLASLLAGRRAKPAKAIYELIGGRSPLLENTRAQAAALAEALTIPTATPGAAYGVFVAMRYWHPFSAETAAEVKAFAPDRVVLLPLYPQWSTTTTASSLRVWKEAAAVVGLEVPTRLVCCYPEEPGFIAAIVDLLRPAYRAAAEHGRPRVLFSAHGLPRRVVEGGDPYAWQCERTVAAIVAAFAQSGLDHVGCYQSRVGPMAWIGPSTDDEIRRAGAEGVPLVVVPIAFVSEHSETLVELDIEYRHLATRVGVPHFERVGTVGTHPSFIRALAELARFADAPGPLVCRRDGRICPPGLSGCAYGVR